MRTNLVDDVAAAAAVAPDGVDDGTADDGALVALPDALRAELDTAINGLMPRLERLAWFHAARTGLDVHDLLQEGAVRAMLSFTKYDPEAGTTITTWLLTQASYGMRDHIRSEFGRRRPDAVTFKPGLRTLVSLDMPVHADAEGNVVALVDMLPAFDDLPAWVDLEDLLDSAGLTARERAVLRLRMDGTDLHLIGSAYGVGESAVSLWVKTIGRKLAKRFREERRMAGGVA